MKQWLDKRPWKDFEKTVSLALTLTMKLMSLALEINSKSLALALDSEVKWAWWGKVK